MEFVTTREELRTIYKTPRPMDGSIRKELKALDGHCRSFIGKSPFVLIGSSDGEGNADVTPKGDKPGFAAVLDDRTIAIPDRPGNNRLDTLENILLNPSVGLLFLIPGMNETLRVNGDARITVDAALRERLAVDGKEPQSVVVVAVKAAYMHCAKAFMRSELWKPESWHDRATLPTLGQILRDQLALADSAEATDRWLDDEYKQTMW
ncbi:MULTISPECIES: pyridoxamine 5'-phosphate oxidase family protein [unclassified Mesorhizobium]|uniref:pyridoxamine 5'-phosphate oxidase family protein n=1 Tax=unclassified Mesorhizobium TaxID=325217 RepID=UPI001128C514|nr:MULTISPECIES: pyridoxamine 5'-phosphate oxidase family protein [unclassified Mesorhizobium]TPJ50152.1 pyridoxamine 5'-phosphate oxidase family protein [Mesorhizobium sp. B2-6-6]MBZ9998976.1 pyridoxamine 5'-phosphate oxidase family protein [Mesorhizobium sp. B264B2A]MCA0009274.1 pyridoxamine 5'-phosphate oxidase family protein [Mesorhizobium sp. B264B1B]MCA0018921.1 pyridoxamine 5'-phosphate oxidase family protein [Mesorhizobium sp. B264B1A]TPI55502.1 pyridoxamine 5'-phosphate oxidase family